MAVTMADIQHLRKMTGAGMMDCKNALTEANNDMEKAIELIRNNICNLSVYVVGVIISCN